MRRQRALNGRAYVRGRAAAECNFFFAPKNVFILRMIFLSRVNPTQNSELISWKRRTAAIHAVAFRPQLRRARRWRRGLSGEFPAVCAATDTACCTRCCSAAASQVPGPSLHRELRKDSYSELEQWKSTVGAEVRTLKITLEIAWTLAERPNLW